ncbi:ATP-dependent RNA helicase-like protein, partial [Lachnellula willkommii]
MAEQEVPEFLRDLDPATALAIARLQLPDLQNELAILRAVRDEDEEETDEERLIRDESEFLQQAITALHAVIPKSPCVVCEDIFENPVMATLPCDHKFCCNCLQELFQRSQIDETLFPPRCCEPIPPEQVREFLTPELITMHEEKKVEFETADRTYCSDLQCHRFLRPENITADLGTCPTCNESTCTKCKTTAHEGNECPRDEATEALLSRGRERGWRRCFSCRSLVQRTYGCNHIICRCGSEFCYQCGLIWDTCGCLLWNNTRQLLLRQPRGLNEAVVVAPQPPPVAVIQQAAAPPPVPVLDVAVGIEALPVPLRPAAPPAQLIIANAIPPPAEAPLPPDVLVVAPQHAPAAPPQAAQPRIIAPQNDGVAPAEVEPVVDAPRNVVPNVPQPPQPQAVPVIWDTAQQPNIAPLLVEGGPCNH